MNVAGDMVGGLGRGIMIGGLLTVLTAMSGGPDAKNRQADCTAAGLGLDVANDNRFVVVVAGLRQSVELCLLVDGV